MTGSSTDLLHAHVLVREAGRGRSTSYLLVATQADILGAIAMPEDFRTYRPEEVPRCQAPKSVKSAATKSGNWRTGSMGWVAVRASAVERCPRPSHRARTHCAHSPCLPPMLETTVYKERHFSVRGARTTIHQHRCRRHAWVNAGPAMPTSCRARAPNATCVKPLRGARVRSRIRSRAVSLHLTAATVTSAGRWCDKV